MNEWQQPHWSGRPQPEPDRRPRLRPNIFARVARYCARRNAVVLISLVFISTLAAVVAIAKLHVDPYAVSRIELDPQTISAQQRLDSNFPGIDSTFVASVDSGNPDSARNSALAVAAALAKRNDLFIRAFVPGTGTYYAKYGILFRSTEDIETNVAAALQMQPLYQALGQAPDIGGLAALISEISKAVEQGRSPRGLADLLLAISASVEGEISRQARPVNWPRLAGLSAALESKRWFVIATPVQGKEREAAGFAVALAKATPDFAWSFPQQVYGRTGNIIGDTVIPLAAAVLIVVTVLGVGLGSIRSLLPVLATAVSALCLSSGVAAAITTGLDGVTWSFAVACLAPAFLFSIIFVLAYTQSRARGSEAAAAIMLAAHRRGVLLTGLAAMIAGVWSVWIFRQLPSLAQLAEIAAIGTLIAFIVSFTAVPALLAMLDSVEPPAMHWLDAAVAAPVGFNARNALQVIVLVLIAAALFCAVFVPGIRFGDTTGPVLPASALDTPEAQGAVHLLAKSDGDIHRLVSAAARLEETGAIRTIEQFLPLDVDRKLESLNRLETFLPSGPAPRAPTDQASLGAIFESLSEALKKIAAEGATAPDLRDAAHRLRRALSLYANPQMPTSTRVMALEDSLFSGLADLSWSAEQLAKLGKPSLADLDDGLRQRFMAADGLMRIEVLPKPGVGRLAFAAAMRRLDPMAAGTPLVALARNEIMHHEAAIAFTTAFALIALVLLVLVRNILDWIVALAPAGLATCLAAAAVVGAGQSLSSTALGAAMTAIAMCLSASAILVLRARQVNTASPADTAFRAAILPPLAMLAAVAPLAMSGIMPVAATGTVSALFLCIAIIVTMVAVPQLSNWVNNFRRP